MAGINQATAFLGLETWKRLHPRKLACPLNRDHFKRKFHLNQLSIFRGSLPGRKCGEFWDLLVKFLMGIYFCQPQWSGRTALYLLRFFAEILKIFEGLHLPVEEVKGKRMEFLNWKSFLKKSGDL